MKVMERSEFYKVLRELQSDIRLVKSKYSECISFTEPEAIDYDKICNALEGLLPIISDGLEIALNLIANIRNRQIVTKRIKLLKNAVLKNKEEELSSLANDFTTYWDNNDPSIKDLDRAVYAQKLGKVADEYINVVNEITKLEDIEGYLLDEESKDTLAKLNDVVEFYENTRDSIRLILLRREEPKQEKVVNFDIELKEEEDKDVIKEENTEENGKIPNLKSHNSGEPDTFFIGLFD